MKPSGTWTLDTLVARCPGTLALFHAVHSIETLGPITMHVTKIQVSFRATTQFAWVWLPQLWIAKRPENSITLAFNPGRLIDDDRIAGVRERFIRSSG